MDFRIKTINFSPNVIKLNGHSDCFCPLFEKHLTSKLAVILLGAWTPEEAASIQQKKATKQALLNLQRSRMYLQLFLSLYFYFLLTFVLLPNLSMVYCCLPTSRDKTYLRNWFEQLFISDSVGYSSWKMFLCEEWAIGRQMGRKGLQKYLERVASWKD